MARKDKYLVVGGHVRSQNDGDEHYIPARDIARLHNLRKDQFVILPNLSPRNYPQFKGVLVPRYNGNYKDLSDE